MSMETSAFQCRPSEVEIRQIGYCLIHDLNPDRLGIMAVFRLGDELGLANETAFIARKAPLGNLPQGGLETCRTGDRIIEISTAAKLRRCRTPAAVKIPEECRSFRHFGGVPQQRRFQLGWISSNYGGGVQRYAKRRQVQLIGDEAKCDARNPVDQVLIGLDDIIARCLDTFQVTEGERR